jgi:hypothetical protein
MLADVFKERRDIVVTIPKAKQAEVEAEEAYVARQLARGDQEIHYYWEMGRIPKEQPRRVYFVWDGAIRAYHECFGVTGNRLLLRPEIHEVEPEPMASFRGFRYY